MSNGSMVGYSLGSSLDIPAMGLLNLISIPGLMKFSLGNGGIVTFVDMVDMLSDPDCVIDKVCGAKRLLEVWHQYQGTTVQHIRQQK